MVQGISVFTTALILLTFTSVLYYGWKRDWEIYEIFFVNSFISAIFLFIPYLQFSMKEWLFIQFVGYSIAGMIYFINQVLGKID